MEEAFALSDLPQELLYRICRWCGVKDVLALAGTSSSMMKELQPWLDVETAKVFGPDSCVETGKLGPLQVHISKGLDLALMSYAVDWDAFGTPVTRGSLLHLSIYCDNMDAFYLLLRNGADPNVVDTAGSTPLNTAVRYNRNCFARQLVLSGANIHQKNEKGVTALHYAAKRGSVELTRTLLKLGANPNEADNNMNTPLHTAANALVAAELIDGGASLDYKNAGGQTAIEAVPADVRVELELDKFLEDQNHRIPQVNFDIQCL
mmetsp:Transcript_22776/g.32778  ORF Transcript_22776/g.32778 Transcript_22776/m.32778 type:complete len:263 (-) Transcript_22776:125-913(-)